MDREAEAVKDQCRFVAQMNEILVRFKAIRINSPFRSNLRNLLKAPQSALGAIKAYERMESTGKSV
jgi:hypothetical protein